MTGKVLAVATDWIEAHCVVPDGDRRGEFFLLSDEQFTFTANHYLVRENAKYGEKSTAFVYRRSQLVRAQKWGKSPLIAAFTCLEGVGPCLFDGWARGGEVYRCSEHGCGCGWSYEYLPGEPMGRPWSTPLIQITATSEDQTENTYDALRPMIDLGPLSEAIPRTGEEFIRLPGDGRIDVVTSKANSRLGQRVTFVPQDETGIWTKSNGMVKVARTQRRGLSGMGGRAIETTNAWDPSEHSQGQQTFESVAKDIQRDFVQPPPDLRFDVKSERRKIFEFNYRSAPWVSIDAVEAECAELMEADPAEAERFYGNRVVQGSGHWMTDLEWSKKTVAKDVPEKTRVVLGMDLSNNNDWTGIRLETAEFYQFTPTYSVGGEERPCVWDPSKFGGYIPRGEVRAAIDQLAKRYKIVRAYVDPAGDAMGETSTDALFNDDSWRTELATWAAKYGEKTFLAWECSRITPMFRSLEQFRAAVRADDGLTHDDDQTTAFHIRNAVMVAKTGKRYVLGKPHGADTQKIDMAMSSDLAHEAAVDATAAGQFTEADESTYVYF